MIIYAVSDLHGKFPDIPQPCDLLIVGGDICPDGFNGVWARHNSEPQKKWFQKKFLPWVSRQAKQVLVTWGNHDYCGGPVGVCPVFGNVDVVVDDLVEVEGLRIWLTPWSNEFMDWAWMKPHDQLADFYEMIPKGIDILVSHQPPQGFGDLYPNVLTGEMEHIASSELLYTIERVKPKVVVCGHLHGGYGTYHLGPTIIHNVSVVNEQYQLVNPPTEIVL